MKITPLLIFLFILFILVIFSVASNYYKLNNLEGFVSFNYNSNPTTQREPVKINLYSYDNPVRQLYDTVYIDQINANIIDIDSSRYVGNVDSTGSTISAVNVITPNGDNTIYYSNNNNSIPAAESFRTTVPSLYTYWLYTKSMSQNTDNYAVIYISWDKETYIQILNNSQNTNIGVWHSSPSQTSSIDTVMLGTPIGLSGYVEDTNELNGSMVNDMIYGNQLYQITTNVKYDKVNGYLVIQSGSGANRTIKYYDRAFNLHGPFNATGKVNNLPNIITSVNFSATSVLDSDKQNLVTFIVNGTNTIISVVSYSEDKTTYNVNVCKFNSNGLDPGNTGYNPDIGLDDSYVWSPTIILGNQHNQDNDCHSHIRGNTRTASIFDPNNYMLKTQIVPPVCPACPACPTDGLMCTNCGGRGGSGTLSDKGSVAGGNNPASAALDATGDAVGGLATGAGLAVGGVATGAGLAVGGIASGAGEIIGGAENVIGGVASGIGNAIGGVNPTNVSKDNANYNKDRGTQLLNYGNVPMILGTQNQYSDQYSYYGKMPASQTSTYMPVTADFSAFSK